MNLPFYIARKYFFSRKISGVIHVISLISLVGILVGSMALIIILSTFNGFEEVVSKLYNTFDSDLKVLPAKGKYFTPDSLQIEKIRHMKNVVAITPVLEENALLKYRDKSAIATFKAVDPDYLEKTGIDSMIIAGEPGLKDEGINYALVGAGIGSKLELYGSDDMHPIQVYVPKKGMSTSSMTLNPVNAFNRMNIFGGGNFSIQQDFDQRYVLFPIEFARQLVQEPKAVTAVEINVKKDEDIPRVQREVQEMLGDKYRVLDRFQQQPSLYKVMGSEKLVTYLVLSFILAIAAFNLIGALLMLAIEKKKDMAVLMSLGADNTLIRNIIMFEGLVLSVSGAIVGMLLGGIICWLQMKYGFVPISGGSTFVIKSYPVAFNIWDFVIVFITVVVLGFVASYYPATTVHKNISVDLLRSRR